MANIFWFPDSQLCSALPLTAIHTFINSFLSTLSRPQFDHHTFPILSISILFRQQPHLSSYYQTWAYAWKVSVVKSTPLWNHFYEKSEATQVLGGFILVFILESSLARVVFIVGKLAKVSCAHRGSFARPPVQHPGQLRECGEARRLCFATRRPSLTADHKNYTAVLWR